MVAVAAVMEAPAILSALWLISRGGKSRLDATLFREILLNGSIVLLVGAYFIGWITGLLLNRGWRAGRIVAVKGIGGYHLVCDALNEEAVRRLRERKPRPDKPLAVMFPIRGDDGLDAMRDCLQLDDITAEAIRDPARPIVLVRKRPTCDLSVLIAPGLDEVGVMLPYTPLHHILLRDVGRPLVMTSGRAMLLSSGCSLLIFSNSAAAGRLS